MRIILYLIAIFLLLPQQSHAIGVTGERPYDMVRRNPTPDLSQHKEIIWQVENYLSSFKTMEARFTQTVIGRVQIRRGRILISRPAKARWEYKTPVPTTLVINDGRMSYYDEELDQISYADVPNSPLEVLLNENVKLSGDIKIINVTDTKGAVSLTLKDDRNEDNEVLIMTFSKSPLQLQRLHRTDNSNHETSLQLEMPIFNVPLSDDLFSLKNKTSIIRKKN